MARPAIKPKPPPKTSPIGTLSIALPTTTPTRPPRTRPMAKNFDVLFTACSPLPVLSLAESTAALWLAIPHVGESAVGWIINQRSYERGRATASQATCEFRSLTSHSTKSRTTKTDLIRTLDW
jgi:hypothetical protein